MFDCTNLLFPTLDKPIELNKTYTKDELIEVAIDYWITYFECHKCGRWDYCKYAEKHPANPHRSVDIQCGVVKDVLSNYFETTFDLAVKLDKYGRQSYINAGHYLAEYTYYAEQSIGMMMDCDMLDFLGPYAPTAYGQTKHIQNLLDKFHSEMKKIDFFNSKKTELFVEGESEEIIIEGIIGRININNYQGKGRMEHRKMEFLFKEKIESGSEIYVQGDLDGKHKNQNIEKMISKSILKEENVFLFMYDLETAYPINLLHQALIELKITELSLEEFQKDYKLDCSILAFCKKERGIEIPKIKVAEYISKIVRINALNSDKFKKTEFGKFLLFCQHSKVPKYIHGK